MKLCLCLVLEFLTSIWDRHLNNKLHMNIITLQDQSFQDTTKLEKTFPRNFQCFLESEAV